MRAHHRKGKSLAHGARERAGAPPHAVAHHKRGIALQFARFRAAGASAFVAFMAESGDDYQDLDEQFAGLTLIETRLGAFSL